MYNNFDSNIVQQIINKIKNYFNGNIYNAVMSSKMVEESQPGRCCQCISTKENR